MISASRAEGRAYVLLRVQLAITIIMMTDIIFQTSTKIWPYIF